MKGQLGLKDDILYKLSATYLQLPFLQKKIIFKKAQSVENLKAYNFGVVLGGVLLSYRDSYMQFTHNI